MATYYPKYYYQDSVGMACDNAKLVYHERLIDFATQNVNTGDTMKVLAVPAFTYVHNVTYLTVTAVTSASSTFVINSATAGTTYVASAVAVSAGTYAAAPAISAANAAQWYATKDDIQITTVATANLTVGQIRVSAIMLYPQPIKYVDVDGNTQTYTFTDRNNWTTTAPTIP